MIEDHLLLTAEWQPTKHTFGKIWPTLAVIHETGTRIPKGKAVAFCRAPKRTNPVRVAYHIIIERDGTVVQLARFDRKLRHAGVSKYKGRKYCNSFSIGIGLVGPTELKGNERRAKSFYGKWFTSEDGIKRADSPYHGRGHVWLPYTMEQLNALDGVVAELKRAYPGIDVAGHYHVSPRRKIDPSPLLDIAAVGKPPLPVQAPPLDEPVDSVTTPEQELAHAKDQLETLPVADGTSKTDRDKEVDKTLKKESREYRAANTLEKAAAGVTGAGVVSEAAKTFLPADASNNLQYLTTLKSYMDVVGGMITAYGVHLVVIGAVCVYGYCLFIKKFKRQSYMAGLYEPTGADE